MHCFNHQAAPAIGICKSCQKGLCTDCAADLGHGLACKNSHEKAVENLNTLITRNARIQGINIRGKFITPAFYAFLGLAFLGYGLAARNASSYLVVMGVGFLVYGAVIFAVNNKAFGR